MTLEDLAARFKRLRQEFDTLEQDFMEYCASSTKRSIPYSGDNGVCEGHKKSLTDTIDRLSSFQQSLPPENEDVKRARPA